MTTGGDGARSGEGGEKDGGIAARGGDGATGGRGARGGTAGLQQGGAGTGDVPPGCFDPDSEGGAGFCDAGADCECTGDSTWHFGLEYDEKFSSSCGEPRTCTAAICRNDGCNDWYEPFVVETRCCADGRWHLIDGAFQLVERDDNWDIDLRASELSPACGGTAVHSSQALHFGGTSRLELPLSRPVRSPAVELWFRTANGTTPLLSSADTAETLYLDNGRICFYGGSGSTELCTEEQGFADGSWHHAALSYVEYLTQDERANDVIYADGTLRVVGTPGNEAPTSSFRAGFGRVGASATEVAFTGDLDEIRVWAVGPNPVEILDYYTTTIVGPVHRANLVGYFPLEESGIVATIANRAEPAPTRPRDCEFYDWTRNPTYEGSESGGEGGSAGAPSPPANGTLVGFDFSSSPWIAPGAF